MSLTLLMLFEYEGQITVNRPNTFPGKRLQNLTGIPSFSIPICVTVLLTDTVVKIGPESQAHTQSPRLCLHKLLKIIIRPANGMSKFTYHFLCYCC